MIVVLGSIFGAANGGGPFVSASAADNVFSLQIFLVAISLPIMFLAGLVEEQREKAKILSESEARFRSMANSAPALIWMSGLDGRFNFFNKAWLDLTGRTLRQELGNGWAEGLHPEDFHRFFEKYDSSFSAREEFSIPSVVPSMIFSLLLRTRLVSTRRSGAANRPRTRPCVGAPLLRALRLMAPLLATSVPLSISPNVKRPKQTSSKSVNNWHV